MSRNVLPLPGCVPEPILGYLKALGVLRLVAAQKDLSVRGAWSGGVFVLHTALDREGLLWFFLEEYRPTPVLATWNGGSGFWGRRTASAALSALRDSNHPRLASYRDAIARAEAILRSLGLTRKPTDKEKPDLIRRMRSNLPDDAVAWVDAACALTEDRVSFAPLLGTGGNDGNLEFSNNFMQRLAEVIPFDAVGWSATGLGRRLDDPRVRSRRWLEASLLGGESPELVNAAVGQFHPGGVGGPNATQGFEGESVINPWDYVLMIEGALLLAGSVVWRAGSEGRRKAAFPFTVRPSPAGWQTMVSADAAAARQEIWLPLWERPASLSEIAHLLAEGRAQVGTRPAVNGTDFARAVASLGVDRGLAGFCRFGFVRRSGKAFIAAPLGYLPVRHQPNVHLLEEVDPWLQKFRESAREGAESLRRAERAIDSAIFGFCRDGEPRRLQDVLIALSRAERMVARNPEARKRLSPIQGLSLRWLEACNDDSPEFRLARALASVHAFPVGDEPVVGPMRVYLEPVWTERTGRFTWYPNSTSAVWGSGGLVRNLLVVLERRCLDARRTGICYPAPVGGHYTASLKDISIFISGGVDDARVESLLLGLSLLRWPARPSEGSGTSRDQAPPEISRLYAMCKILFHCPHQPGKSLPFLQQADGSEMAPLRPEPALLARLRSGDSEEAVRIAARRLKASGQVLLGTSGSRGRYRLSVPVCPPGFGPRLASALLFPIADGSLAVLARLVLRNPETAENQDLERGVE